MSPVKIGVLISGGGTNLQAIIDEIQSGNINGEIKLVISNKKDAFGLERARNSQIEAMFINPKDFIDNESYNNAIINEMKKHEVELIVLAGYLKVLSKSFIDEFKDRIINIHPSLIPSFCGKNFYGLKVHEEAIKYGVKYSGATVHLVDEGTDTGPIIIQEIVKVEEDDTAESLQKKILQIEHKILVEAIKLFCEGRITIKERIVKINRGELNE